MDYPAAASFVPGARAITFLHSTDGSLIRSLWRHDLDSGERRILAGPIAGTEHEELLDPQERLRRERTRTSELGVTSHAWATHALVPTLLVPLAGQLFVARDAAARAVAPLHGVEGAAGAELSPNGEWVAYSADGDLRVAPLNEGPPLRLTNDAETGVTNGLAEFIAAEELGRLEGLWWGADSRTVAFAHVDERGVPPFAIAHLGTGEPRHEEHRYPFAGGPNALVELRIATLDGAPPLRVDLGMAADDYLARVVPDPAGGWLVAVLPREQRSLHWWRVSPSASARELWVELSEPWLNLEQATRVLDDGRILRATERSGFRHLELRTPDGGLERVLTAGDWVVTGVAFASAERNEVLFTATCDGARERHLYAVSLDVPRPVSAPERLTAEPGWHEIVARRDGSEWIDTFSDLEHAPRVTVHARAGSAPVLVHAAATAADSEGLIAPELLELIAADGRTPLSAALYRPAGGGSDAAATSPPPCVVWVYGGPRSQYVKRSWELTVHAQRQYLAQSGAAVLVVDNRGTNYRGVAFEAALGGRLGSVEVADQAAAVRELARRGEIDPERVAVTGWSYGGFMTVMCMAREPGLFSVGVAGAPVVEWAGYDTAYTERYLRHPARNPDAYRNSSLPAQAAQVTGDLLLVHGTLDENVHLRHSERLLVALQSAGRDTELVLLPDQRHRTRGEASIRLRERRTLSHLLRGLGLPLPDELAVPE